MNSQVAITEFVSRDNQGFAGFSDDGVFSRSSSGNQGQFENGVWDSPSRLSFSFVPDGTAVSDYWESSLFSAFRNLLNETQLKQSIGNAFQSWAAVAGVNFGQNSDSGDPLGIAGLTQGDSRFGDIRIGAIPLQENVLAVALPFQTGMSGTWAGDILFNANAKFASADEFFAVALHEIGHTLGLEHSNNPNDVMYAGGLNTTLSPLDIEAIQNRYGQRMLDQYDSDRTNNDTPEDATEIKLAGSLKGEIPLVAFGDIHSATDVDHYELDIYSNYLGTVTFRVVSAGISQLAPQVAVFDSNGVQLAFSSSTSLTGDDLLLTLTPPSDKLILQVKAAGVQQRDVGSYSLVTLFDSDVQFEPQKLEATITQELWNLEQTDVHTIFSSPMPLFNDDLHTNDSLLTATDLAPVAGVVNEDRFRVQAVIADSVDVDFYRFRVPAAGQTLTATLTSMESLGLVGKLEFYDSNFSKLEARIINNGNGRLIAQLEGLAPGDDYLVQVRADRPGQGFDIGNYNLDLGFRAQAALLNTFAEGQLTSYRQPAIHTLFVAETRLFNLGIEAKFANGFQDAVIWMTIYAENGSIVHQGLTRPGEFRTANSVVLQPGTYSIRVSMAFPDGKRIPASPIRSALSYRILGTSVGDPIGPELIKSGRQPFPKCDPVTNEYCYPGDRHTTATFLVVDGNESSIPNTGTTQPSYQDINSWYWYQNWPGGQGG